jgi:SSS family solute:Na+ symporter
MNTTLIVFVALYLLGTLGLGMWAGTRIKNTADFAVAGRSLPLIMVITTTFATWFGAETVMGMPAKFVQGGLAADRRSLRRRHLPDPGRPVLRLRLYKLNLLTIGDYYRQRYGKGIEVFCSVAIILLPGLGGGADHRAGPGVLGADQWRHVARRPA